MAERNLEAELTAARDEARKAGEQLWRMQTAVAIAAKTSGLTEVEVKQFIALARGPS